MSAGAKVLPRKWARKGRGGGRSVCVEATGRLMFIRMGIWGMRGKFKCSEVEVGMALKNVGVYVEFFKRYVKPSYVKKLMPGKAARVKKPKWCLQFSARKMKCPLRPEKEHGDGNGRFVLFDMGLDNDTGYIKCYSKKKHHGKYAKAIVDKEKIVQYIMENR